MTLTEPWHRPCSNRVAATTDAAIEGQVIENRNTIIRESNGWACRAASLLVAALLAIACGTATVPPESPEAGPTLFPPGTSPPTVTAQKWGAAQAIAAIDVTPRREGGVSAAMNDRGDVAIAYDNMDHFGEPSLSAIHYAAESRTWGQSAVLVGGASTANGTPRVAIDAMGNAFVIWTQFEHQGSNATVYASRFDAPSDSWGPVARLVDDPAGHASGADIAADEGGGAFAVWQRNDGATGSLVVSRYADGWAPPALLDPGFASNLFPPLPRVAADASGRAIVVWSEPNAKFRPLVLTNALASRRYSPGTGWEPKVAVPLGAVSDPKMSRSVGALVTDAAGDAVLLWESNASRGPSTIYASLFDRGAGWGSPVQLDAVDIARASPERLRIHDRGLALATWGRRLSRYEPGTGWSSPVSLTADLVTDGASLADQQHQMALDAVGNVLAVGKDVSTMRPAFATYVFGRGWSAVSPLDAAIAYDYEPFLAANRKGRALIVWSEGIEFIQVPCGTGRTCFAPTRLRLWARFYE